MAERLLYEAALRAADMSCHACGRIRRSHDPPPFVGQNATPERENVVSHPPANLVESESDPSVFVGNLPFDCTEQILRELVVQVGPIWDLRLLKDANGRPRGMAFVDYVDMPSAMYAVGVLNGLQLGGRALRVNLARPPSEAFNDYTAAFNVGGALPRAHTRPPQGADREIADGRAQRSRRAYSPRRSRSRSRLRSPPQSRSRNHSQNRSHSRSRCRDRTRSHSHSPSQRSCVRGRSPRRRRRQSDYSPQRRSRSPGHWPRRKSRSPSHWSQRRSRSRGSPRRAPQPRARNEASRDDYGGMGHSYRHASEPDRPGQQGWERGEWARKREGQRQYSP